MIAVWIAALPLSIVLALAIALSLGNQGMCIAPTRGCSDALAIQFHRVAMLFMLSFHGIWLLFHVWLRVMPLKTVLAAFVVILPITLIFGNHYSIIAIAQSTLEIDLRDYWWLQVAKDIGYTTLLAAPLLLPASALWAIIRNTTPRSVKFQDAVKTADIDT